MIVFLHLSSILQNHGRDDKDVICFPILGIIPHQVVHLGVSWGQHINSRGYHCFRCRHNLPVYTYSLFLEPLDTRRILRRNCCVLVWSCWLEFGGRYHDPFTAYSCHQISADGTSPENGSHGRVRTWGFVSSVI